MVVKSEDKVEVPDEEMVHEEEDESSGGGGGGDAEDSDDQSDDDASGDEVDIQGTKFNLSRVAEDAKVDESEEEEEEDSSDDEPEDDEGAKADQEESGSDDDDAAAPGKSGWADAMAKVLNMGKDSESAPGLLSKAKLDSSAPAPEGEAGAQPRECVRRAIKKEIEDTGRVRPDVVKDRAREKALVKLATRGVVQLFNAVRDQQKDLKSQLSAVGHSTRKREQVYKSIDKEGFLDVLSGGGGNKRNSGKPEHTQPAKKKAKAAAALEKEEESSSWSVIKDDYMLGAKMKDWDKESDTEEVG